MTNWQVRISDQVSSGAVDVFIFRKVAEGKAQYVSNLSGKGGVEVKTVDEGTRMEPCIQLDWSSQQMLQAITDGLFNFGIKPTQQPVLQNELTATKYHLSDMRDMVCIVSGIKKGEDLGKDSKYGENRGGVACRPGD